MAVKKIENGPRFQKVTSSAVTPGRNHGKKAPATADHIEIINTGEAQMDGLTGMTMDTTKNLVNLTKTTAEIASFGQGNVEAIIKSGQVWAAGWQDISKTMAAATQTHLDQSLSSWKALISVKSLKEAMDLQVRLAQTAFQTAFAETGKLTNASMKLAEQTIAPITERITQAAEKVAHPAN
jgi:phasin family protein